MAERGVNSLETTRIVIRNKPSFTSWPIKVTVHRYSEDLAVVSRVMR